VTIFVCLLYHKPADSQGNLFSASFCQNLQTWTNIETGAECILTGLPTARKENDAGSRLKLPGIWPGHRPNFCGSQQGPEELPQWVGSGDCDALPKTLQDGGLTPCQKGIRGVVKLSLEAKDLALLEVA